MPELKNIIPSDDELYAYYREHRPVPAVSLSRDLVAAMLSNRVSISLRFPSGCPFSSEKQWHEFLELAYQKTVSERSGEVVK
jgi:hypothetical protein